MPLRQPPHERERTGLDQEVIGMLALSGVVRPSHIGLRYAIPLLTSRLLTISHFQSGSTSKASGVDPN